MKLNYRGVNYESNSPILEVSNSNPADATLKYRGNNYATNAPVVATNVDVATASNAALQVKDEANAMQLNYRGVNYESNSPVLELHNSNPADATLKYRGNTYVTNLPVVAATEAEVVAVPLVATEVAPVVSSSNDRARALMMNRHRQVKQRQQVMLTRLATSIGLNADEAAKYWNHIQGKVHPSFWATYDRSHAASS